MSAAAWNNETKLLPTRDDRLIIRHMLEITQIQQVTLPLHLLVVITNQSMCKCCPCSNALCNTNVCTLPRITCIQARSAVASSATDVWNVETLSCMGWFDAGTAVTISLAVCLPSRTGAKLTWDHTSTYIHHSVSEWVSRVLHPITLVLLMVYHTVCSGITCQQLHSPRCRHASVASPNANS